MISWQVSTLLAVGFLVLVFLVDAIYRRIKGIWR